MSALDAILTIGERVTVRVPMRRPTVIAECVAKRTIEITDQTGVAIVQPGWDMQLVAFLDHGRYTICLWRTDVILIATGDLIPFKP